MLKQFSSKVALYLLVFILIINAVNKCLNYTISDNRYYLLDSSINTLILGHSHAECAYDDTLIKSARNFGQSGESYFYTFVKLRKLTEANPQIKHVLIEFTNNNVDQEMDQWTYESSYLKFHYKKYGHLLTLREKLFLFFHNPASYVEALPLSSKSELDFIRDKNRRFYDFADWGKYVSDTRSHIDSFKKVWAAKQISYSKMSKATISTAKLSKYNLQFLDSIIQYCQRKNISVVLLRAPQHADYKSMISDSIFYETRKRYKKITVFDLANMKLKNEEFLDFQHVNIKGAAEVSRKVDSFMSKQLF